MLVVAGDALAAGGVGGPDAAVRVDDDLDVDAVPTVIQLQARHVDATGAALVAQIYPDVNGHTTLRYLRAG